MKKSLPIRARNFSATAAIIAVAVLFISNKSQLNNQSTLTEGSFSEGLTLSNLAVNSEDNINIPEELARLGLDINDLKPLELASDTDTDIESDNFNVDESSSSTSGTTQLWNTSFSNEWPEFTLDDRVSYYAPVQLNSGINRQLAINATVSLSLPEQKEVKATITSIKHTANGDITWKGYVDGHGDSYPVVYTSGKTNTFATITTPDGSYSMETVNGNGWVYQNPAATELSSPGSTDYLIPGQ